MTLEQMISAIRPLDENSMEAAQNRFANIAMPLGGLGLLQDAIVQLAGILGQPVPDISKRVAVIFCADNGVVAEGVTQCGQEVTATVAENMGRGESTMCLMAKQLGMDVFPVDIGVARPIESEKVLQFNVLRGTKNFAKKRASEFTAKSFRVKTKTATTGTNFKYTESTCFRFPRRLCLS